MSKQIPIGWQERSLASLGDYINGFAFNDEQWSELGLPIVRIAQITGSQGIVDRFQGQLPDTYRIENGDLIFSWSGTLAVVRWFGGTAWLNQHLFKVVNRRDVSRSFLFHQLQHSVAEMNKRTHGSTMKHIKRGELEEFIVSIPVDSNEQAKIATVLDTLDTSIHQTEAIIEKLKQIKQGLLHDLLTRGVDANGELRPSYEQAPELYQASPLGWIPKKWDCGNLDNWLDGKPKNGFSPLEAPEQTGIQMLGLGCLTVNGFSPIQLKSAPRGEKRLANAMLSKGDLLISRANTRELVGLVGVYLDVGTPCAYPDLMMRLKPSSDTSAEFLHLALQSPKSRRQIQMRAVGTSESMVKISSQIVSSILVALPKKIEQNQILKRMASCDIRLITESSKAKVLHDIKSALMDDLLTGRVRVTPLLVP